MSTTKQKPPRNGAPPPLLNPTTKSAKESPGLGNWLVALGQKPGHKDRDSTPARTHPISSLAKAAKETPTNVSNSFAALDEVEDDDEDRMEEEDVVDGAVTADPIDTRMQDMEGRNVKAGATMAHASTPTKKARRNSPPQSKSNSATVPVPPDESGNAEELSKKIQSKSKSTPRATKAATNAAIKAAKKLPPEASKLHNALPSKNSTDPTTPKKSPPSATLVTPAKKDNPEELVQPPNPDLHTKQPAKRPSKPPDDDSSVDTKKATTLPTAPPNPAAEAHKGVSARVTCQAEFSQGSAEDADGMTKVKQSAGKFLDFMMSTGDTNLILHGRGKKYASSPPVNFEALLTNMETNKAKKLLGIEGKVNNDATTITTSILFELTSSDPKALDNLNARCFAKLGNSSVVITSCTVRSSSSTAAKKSLKAQMEKANKLEEMSGGKVYRTEYCRFTLKLDLWSIPKHAKHKDSADYDKFVYQYLGETFDWINTKLGCDLLFCRWRKAFLISPISSKDGPFKKQFKAMNFLEFKKIFHRAIANPERRDMWGDVLIAFNCEKPDFQEFCRDQVSPKKGLSLYPKHLQDAEDTKPLFWILWSHDLLETKPLQETLSRLLKVEVEIRLKRINDDTKRGTKEEEMKKRAWHIQVSSDDEHMAHSTLKLLCRAGNPRNPLFSGQKLIPITGECLTDTEQAFMAKSIGRQHSFNEMAATIPCGSIKYLDMEVDTPSGHSISLRQAIGRMKRKDDPKVSLFMEVGWRISRRDGPTSQVLFVVTPEVRAEAQLAVNSLLPYCRHKYGDNIVRCFQASIVSAMAHITWDPVLLKAVSPNDAELEQMEEADALLGFDLDDEADDGAEGTGRMVDATPANALRSKMITGNKEVDTLGSYDAAKQGKPLPKAPPIAQKDGGTVISKDATEGTQTTSGTTRDKVSQLEAKLKAIAIKAGLWDSDDESISTTLTQQEKVQYLTQKVAEVAKLQAAQESWQKQKAASRSQATSSETTKETPAITKDVNPEELADGISPASAMDVDSAVDTSTAVRDVATKTGLALDSAVEVIKPAAGTNRESAIFLSGGSLSDSSDTTRDYSALIPPPIPPKSVDSLDALLAQAPPGAAKSSPLEETIPEEIDPAASGSGKDTSSQEEDDLTDDGSNSESSQMVRDESDNSDSAEASESDSKEESESDSESESDDESDGLVPLEDGNQVANPTQVEHDSASSGTTGAGED